MAGISEGAYSDGIGANARLNCPKGVVCTSDGSKVVVADGGNMRLRLIDTSTNAVITLTGEEKHSDGKAFELESWFLAFDRTTSIPDSVLYITYGWNVGGILRRFDFRSGLRSSCAESLRLPLLLLLF